MKNFKDKVIWITGGSSGIGAEMARQSNAMGAVVILSSRRATELENVKAGLSYPVNAYVLELDMEDQKNFPGKVKEVIDRFGRVDLLFNNAGISQRSYIHETSMEVDRKLMEINYFGTVALTKALLPYLRKQKESYIAVNSSLAAKFGFYQRSAYSASKFALHGFFETLALEESENNIGVSMLCAVGIKTQISQNALDGKGARFGKSSALQEEGISVEKCVKKMIKAIQKKQPEVIIGRGMQPFSVIIKALFPEAFIKMLKKQKP